MRIVFNGTKALEPIIGAMMLDCGKPMSIFYSDIRDVDGVTFYMAHGHHENPEQLPDLKPGSVFLSGHTHVKMDEIRGHIRCINPGSVSIPKDGSHSCLLYENGVFTPVLLEDEDGL